MIFFSGLLKQKILLVILIHVTIEVFWVHFRPVLPLLWLTLELGIRKFIERWMYQSFSLVWFLNFLQFSKRTIYDLGGKLCQNLAVLLVPGHWAMGYIEPCPSNWLMNCCFLNWPTTKAFTQTLPFDQPQKLLHKLCQRQPIDVLLQTFTCRARNV